jgi:serine/threonine protein kinase
MVEIFVNDSLKIIQDKNNKTMYKIEFNYPCPALVRSLIKTRIIESGTLTDDYITLRFKAMSVKSFPQFIEDQNKVRGTKSLSITLAANMISSLSAQLSHLISKESQTIIGYAPENIIVINGNTFAFLDSELVAYIDPVGKEMATISCPFNVTDFFASPEMLKIKELPSQVHYKTSYFSLGCLLLYALTGGSFALTGGSFALLEEDNFYKKYLKELNCEKVHEYLDQLHFKNTKLYWLLSRCLVEDPGKRTILFI